jgi:hypothetical protein
VDGQLYTYAIFTKDTDNLWNQTAVYTTGKRDDPPAPVSSFTASNNVAGQINLQWTNPGSLDLAQVKVYRLAGVTVPAIDANGATTNGATQIYLSQATPGAQVNVTDGVSPSTGQTYTYAVFTKDAGGKWNQTAVSDQGERYDAPAQITNFNATQDTPAAGSQRYTWTNPTYPNLAEVRLIIRTDHAPANYDDITGGGAIVVNSTDGGPPFSGVSGAAITYDRSGLGSGIRYSGVFSKGTNGLKQNASTPGLNTDTATNA